MGSPIPSLEEGAWVCKDSKVVGEGQRSCVRQSLQPGTIKEHGYVTLPSRLVGAVLANLDVLGDLDVSGDLNVSTNATWSTGHSAIHFLVTWSKKSFSSMFDSVDG